jgi:hypothetical protein
MAVSEAAVEHTIERLGLKEDFSRAFTPHDVGMLILAHRHKWVEFMLCFHRPLNHLFLCMGAFRLLEIHGDVEAYEFIMSFIPDDKVEEFRLLFNQLNFVCFPKHFPKEKRVRFAV